MSIQDFSPLAVAFGLSPVLNEDPGLDELSRAATQSPLLRVEPDPEIADLRVELYPNSLFRFYRRKETVAIALVRIPFKRSQGLPRKLRQILEHLYAYQWLLTLKPPLPVLQETVKVQFLRLTQPATRKTEAEVASLSPNAVGELEMLAGQNLAVSVTNTSSTPIFCYLLALDSRRFGVNLVYPYNPDLSAKLNPQESVLMGSGPTYVLEMQLPPDEPYGLDTFKLLVSNSALDPKVMVMPPLGQRVETSTDPYGTGSNLDRHLRRGLLGLTGLTTPPDFNQDPWGCLQQPIRIVNP